MLTPAQRTVVERTEELRSAIKALHSTTADGRIFFTDHEIHTALFQDQHVQIDFDLLRTDSHGETFAEVTVYLDSAAAMLEGPLNKSRLNLLSSNSKVTLANTLDRRTKDFGFAWESMVEWASIRALTAYRNGQPTEDLWDAPDPPAENELLGNFISPSGVTIFFGDGGTGKSTLLLAFALALRTGSEAFIGIKPLSTRKVLYLDWEDEDWVHKDRMRQLMQTDERPVIRYLRMDRPVTDAVDQLRAVVRDEKIELVALDSLAQAAGGDANEQEIASNFYRSVRRLAVPVITIAHNTKAQDEDKPFGSTFFHNGARRTWFVKKHQSPGADRITVGLFSKKNNLGPQYPATAFEYVFSDEHISIRPTEVKSVPALAQRLPLKIQIAEVLKRGALAIWEIAEELDATTDAVRVTLKRGEGKLFVTFTAPDGTMRWGLKSNSSNPNNTSEQAKHLFGPSYSAPNNNKSPVRGCCSPLF
jgi:hypothetical protein